MPPTNGGTLGAYIEETNMTLKAIEGGWRRFLDRLKELWGKLSASEPGKTLSLR